MKEQYQRVNGVVKMLSVGKSTVWAWVKAGKFPPPIKLSDYVTVWKLSDIDDFVHQRQTTGDWINNQIIE
jgi:prophage regulatory protein